MIDFLARPEGFEPPTPRFVVWCSVQLSYGRFAIDSKKILTCEVTEILEQHCNTSVCYSSLTLKLAHGLGLF